VTKAKFEEPPKPEKPFKNHENALKRILKDKDVPEELKALVKQSLQIIKSCRGSSKNA
jgi:uncharacterized protein (UPF0147 family)